MGQKGPLFNSISFAIVMKPTADRIVLKDADDDDDDDAAVCV